MAADLAVVAVYHPPRLTLPYLAVAITPDGRVHGVTADTAAEAQKIVGSELAKAAAEQNSFLRKRILKEHVKLVTQNHRALAYLEAFLPAVVNQQYSAFLEDVDSAWQPEKN